MPWNKGKKLHYTPPASFKKGQNAGAKHPRWKGGYIFYWKDRCLERDNFTCQLCGLREPKIMEVAHIKPIKGRANRFKVGHKLNHVNNLITLCPNDHKRYDYKLVSLNPANSVKDLLTPS